MDDTAKTPEAENTQTRRTVRLPMPPPAGSGEDTHTRKTVKIKPLASPSNTASRPIQPVIASPLRGRDTDTGNLSVMADTQTRRTVKLKPMTAASAARHPVQVPGIAVPAAPAAPVTPADDEVTGKIKMVKPAPAQSIPIPHTAPAASAAPTVKIEPLKPAGDDTVTGKITLPKPASAAAAGVPISKRPTMVLPQNQQVSDATASIAKPKLRIPTGSAPVPERDAAKRPTVNLTGMPQTGTDTGDGAKRPTVNLAEIPQQPGTDAAASAAKRPTITLPGDQVPVSKQTMVLPESEEEDSATVRIARPAAKHPAAKPVLTPKPDEAAKPVPTPKPDEEEEKKPVLKKKADKPDEEDEESEPQLKDAEVEDEDQEVLEEETDEETDEDDAGKPGILCTVLTAVAAILLLLSAGLSTVSYLNLYNDAKISLPGMSAVK